MLSGCRDVVGEGEDYLVFQRVTDVFRIELVTNVSECRKRCKSNVELLV